MKYSESTFKGILKELYLLLKISDREKVNLTFDEIVPELDSLRERLEQQLVELVEQKQRINENNPSTLDIVTWDLLEEYRNWD